MDYQIQLPFNRIELDKTLSLAPNPKRVNGYWATQSYVGNDLVDSMANQFKKSSHFSGKRFRRAMYAPIISTILANLLNAHTHKLQIIYSRDDHSGNRPWISVWDFLVELQFVNTVIGGKNETGVGSWCVALPELVALLHTDQSRIIFDRHKPSIEVRDVDKNVLPLSQHRATKLKYTRLDKATKALNELWQAHTVTLDKKIIVPFVQRKFNDTLELGGRFYGAFQQIPSKDRARLKFDKASTVELDYSVNHLAILYAWQGIQIDYAQAYSLQGYERDTIKAITLRALNIKSLSHLRTAITLSANPANQDKYKAYKAKRAVHDLLRSKGLVSKAPYKPKWIDTFITNIPSTTIADDLVASFLERHEAIKEHIGSQDIGLKLQAADSQIMALVLDTLRLENVPALPVHDSIIIKESDQDLGLAVMAASFEQITGFKAQIK